MCGIVGYLGDKPCIPLIYDGLTKLEYRGYDSAGIAVAQEGRVALAKSEGKLERLKSHLKDLPASATMGIGHTRWATHGAPNTINSHPHSAGDFAIVHNGIIENYLELKEELEAEGIKFYTETDSEVAMQYLRAQYNKLGSLEEAIKKSVKVFRGSYAIGILDPKQNNFLYVIKHGSPVVIGIGDNECFFASDAPAIVAHTQKAIFLNDGEFARISKDNIKVWDFDGKASAFRIAELSWSSEAADKQGYRHFMLKEMHEQPVVIQKAIARLIDVHTGDFNEAALGIDQINLEGIKNINIIGCGSAYHAGQIAKYFLEPLLGLPVTVELASEFRYRDPYIRDTTLTLAISQSGETLDTLTAVKFCLENKSQVLALCNVEYSSIVRAATSTCYMHAGPEIGVASTKAFTLQVFCLYAVGLAIAKKIGRLKDNDLKAILNDLRVFPNMIEQALAGKEAIELVAQKFYETTNFLFVGRGLHAPVASEGALKLKEISYVFAEAYAGGELKHGPIALVDKKMAVLAIVPSDFYFEKMVSNVEEIKAREGRIVVVGDNASPRLRNLSEAFIHCPQIATPALQAILTTVPLQLFAYFMALKRGTDVDQPRNLAKSVTVE